MHMVIANSVKKERKKNPMFFVIAAVGRQKAGWFGERQERGKYI